VHSVHAYLLISKLLLMYFIECCVGDSYVDYVKKIHEKFTNVSGLNPPNKEQKVAVKAAMFQPFSLIQGPPGTGKSVTVVRLAALYVFVNRELDPIYRKNNIKPQVMICGPSNKSVDVIAGTLTAKAKFHYAIWSQTGPKLVADMQRTGIWPII